MRYKNGGVNAVASAIENALGKAIPVVIGFLASLLGLSGLAQGYYSNIANSSIGSQWKTRVANLHSNVDEQTATLTNEQKQTVLMNVELKIE